MCSVQGCERPDAGKYSALCGVHTKAKRKHGHPLQAPVNKIELRRYEKAVKKFLDTRSTGEAWTRLRDVWDGVVSIAKKELADYYKRGQVKNRYSIKAADIILKVSKDAQPEEVILVLLGMGFLFESDPKRFKDDTAFMVQSMRAFRKLSTVNRLESFNEATGSMKYKYKDVPMKVNEALYGYLKDTFIRHGAAIARKLNEEQEKIRKAHMATREAIITDRFDVVA